MRCFLAVDLPMEIKKNIGEVAREAKRVGLRGSFVPQEQIHVTLAFFGEVSEAQIEEKKRVLERECATTAPFNVKVKGVGFLPDSRRPRVFYAAADSPALIGLQKKLALALRYDEGRPFHAHATIARLKPGFNRDALEHLIEKFGGAEFGEFEARELAFKKSTLTRGGAIHETIARIPLAQTE
ncbi:MAG: RNA 2',3'-cyclic phosphodiesterase [Candidatus Norongarragalinales archaeon]